jgi:hypothetical protein
MNRTFAAVVVLAAFAAALSSTPARAQSSRSFVSVTGSDANLTCTIATPCRSFQWAFSRTNSGGEIYVLDTGGYGSVTIDRDISIVNDGVGAAGITVPSGQAGITINGNAFIRVNLRGLIIEGDGSGQTGILYNSGKSLTVENCVIRNLAGEGIRFTPSISSNLTVSNTFIADNGGNAIFVGPTGAGTVNATFNRVELLNNAGGSSGIFVNGQTSTGTIRAAVSDSVSSNNGVGFAVVSAPGQASAQLTVVRSLAANNGVGLSVNGSAGAILRIAQSTITGNTTGWSAFSGGVLLSGGDNTIEGNTGSETAPTTYIRK